VIVAINKNLDPDLLHWLMVQQSHLSKITTLGVEF